MNRRQWLGNAGTSFWVPPYGRLSALALSIFARPTFAQTYPFKPIKIIVPFPVGGVADIYARLIAGRLTETLGQPVVVENKAGAGGNIAAEQVARSAADGYTLVMGSIGTHAINTSLYQKLAYDPIKDFAPIAFVAEAEGLLVVNSSLPVNNLADLIALAKSKPGGLNYASAGIGSTSHLAAEIFKDATKTFITHLAYKGNVPAMQDVVGGYAQLSFATLPTVLPLVRAGKLKAIAVLGAERSSTMPQIPTVAQAGVPGFAVPNWIGLLAPAGTPGQIIEKLNQEIVKILRSPETQARMAQEGLRPQWMNTEQFAGFIRAEVSKWAVVIKRVGVTAE